ncbi:hypothetical protein DRH14_02835 [Candidatus Shapirobacteria bacterium]|nr:MAG: hypothetical protein DRH14_02835 [Candidatus Shapirobacteria bacterium]
MVFSWPWIKKSGYYPQIVSKTKELINDYRNLSEDKPETKDEKVCGDGVCSENERGNCCQDCGCPAGQYCGDDDVCRENLVFKPIPKPFRNFEIKTDFSKIAGLDFDTKAFRPVLPLGSPTEEENQDGSIIISAKEEMPGAVSGPHIYGNKVIFSQFIFNNDDTNKKAFVYDVISGKTEEIPYNADISSPDIGQSGIVWDDRTRQEIEGSDIYYYNFANNQQGHISLRYYSQISPLISGRSIAWKEESNKGFDLYLYWIPSGEEVKVFNGGTKKFFANYALYRGNVVFTVNETSDDGKSSSQKMYTYSLADHKYDMINNGGDINIRYVDIWDKNVVYIANDQIYVYNLDSKLTKTITGEKSEKNFVAIYEDRVVWSDKRYGQAEIYYYNLKNGQEKRLSNNDVEDILPDIYQNVVVWKSGNRYVRLLKIE